MFSDVSVYLSVNYSINRSVHIYRKRTVGLRLKGLLVKTMNVLSLMCTLSLPVHANEHGHKGWGWTYLHSWPWWLLYERYKQIFISSGHIMIQWLNTRYEQVCYILILWQKHEPQKWNSAPLMFCSLLLCTTGGRFARLCQVFGWHFGDK